MSSTFLGYRIACDMCGVQLDRDTAGPLTAYDFQSATQLRALAAEQGWTCTTYRRADGSWTVYTLERLKDHHASRGGMATLLDACPVCAPNWTPPYSKSANLQMGGQPPADVLATIARLVDENAKLRAELVESRG